MINFEKSEYEPTQKIDFLGYHFDLELRKVFQPKRNLKYLQIQFRTWISHHKQPQDCLCP